MPRSRTQVALVRTAVFWSFAAASASAAHRVYEDAEPGVGSVSIVHSGKPKAIIVVAENPTRPAQVAAKELVHYVRKMTGTELRAVVDAMVPNLTWSPRRVLVGESALTRAYGLKSSDFEEQEHLIQTRGQDLVLMGRDVDEYGIISYEKNGLWPTAMRHRRGHPCFVPMGSLYAVHTFLEKCCGVRWYLPGEIGEVCPQKKHLAVRNVNLRTKPWTRYRWSSRQSYRKPSYFYGSREPDQLVRVPARDMVLYMLRSKMGGSPYANNHSFNSYYRRFGKQHPEWWKGGKPSTQFPHPNYIDPSLIQQAAQDGIDYFSGQYPNGKYPDGSRIMAAGDYFAVMPLDGRRGLIWSKEGEKLRNRDPAAQAGFSCGWASNYVFTFVSRVAKIIGERFPGKWITCAAYGPYFLPPDELESNVAITHCGLLHSAVTADSWRLYADNLAAWSRRTKQLYVWEWYLQQAQAKFRVFPVVFPRQVARAIGHMRDVGVKGMFFEASAAPAKKGPYSDATLANPAEDLLNHYVTWKLLSDASIDIDTLLAEHYRLFYGPAAKPIGEFFGSLEAAWNRPEAYEKGLSRARRYWEVMCRPDELGKYEALIQRALALATAEPFATRVRLMQAAIYRRVERNCLAHAARYRSRPRVACPLIELPPTIDGRLDEETWQRASRTPPFTRLAIRADGPRTQAYLARDAESLYLAFDCAEPQMGIEGDRVGIFVDVGRTRQSFYHLVVDGAGSVTDSRVEGKFEKVDAGWDSRAVAKVSHAEDRWTAEIAVPLAALDAAPTPGCVWGLNLCRVRPTGDTTWWSLTHTGAKSPDDFGVAVMGKEAGAQGPCIALEFDEPVVGRQRLPGLPQFVWTGGGKSWDSSCQTDGKIGKACIFRREAKRYVRMAPSEKLGLDRDDFTVMLWFRTSDSGAQTLAFSTTTSPYWGLSIGTLKDKRVIQFLIGAPTPGQALRVPAPAADGEWHHLTLTVDRGAFARLYVDGEIQGEADIRRHRLPLKRFLSVGGPYKFSEGTMDAFRVYRGALEPARVRRVYVEQQRR